ncbi:MAG: M48 family metallopeptidase [Fimbriimonas sp.]
MAERKYLKGITADAFTSDADRWTLDKLKRVPLLPLVVAKFYELGLDRWMYIYNMSMSVRCGPQQYPSLHAMLQEACRVLDMPEPELYLCNNPFPNAMTSGVERPYITLHNSLLSMPDDQIMDVIGHELGHIKAEHVLYRSVASVLLPILDALGQRTFGAGNLATYPLLLAFYEWMRQAEFSADRAGLLVTQDLSTSQRTFLSLAGGPSRFDHEQNVEAFMDQARAYQDADGLDQVGKVIIFMLMGKYSSHPMPVHRAQELEKWYLSGAYDLIMEGKYEGAPRETADV